jgi:hypothetical protein
MKKIFVSYSNIDSKAEDIMMSLSELGEREDNPLSSPFDVDFIFPPIAPESAFDHIKRASLVVAILGEQRTNVLLELGYALGIGKPVILVADFKSALPFDIHEIPSVEYRRPTGEILERILEALRKLSIAKEPDFPLQLEAILALRVDLPERFERLPGYVFETAVNNAFAQRGHMVESVDSAQAYGYDFRLRRSVGDVLVEVKKNSINSKVSIAAVQQLLGAVFAYEAAKGLLICTSDFTDSARGFAERHSDKILLWTTGDLEQFANGQLSV